MRWFAVLALGAIILGHGSPPLTGLAFAGGLLVSYLISLQRHPRRVCRACNGTGRHRGAMFWWGDRACTTCGGSSRHRRWGVQALRGGSGQRAWGEQAPKDAARRRGAIR
jgi:hypothetical protein